MKHILVLCLLGTLTLWGQESYYYSNHTKETLTPMVPTQTQNRSLKSMQYYKTSKGIVLGVGRNIIVKLENEKDLAGYMTQYGLKKVRKLSTTLYLLQNTTNANTLNIANTLAEEKGVVYAHPDFSKKMFKR